MKRIGFGTGYAVDLTVRDMIGYVKEVEDRGFDLAFFSETFWTRRDAISAMSAFALSTNRILLACTQTLRIRTPLVLAQTFATLDELSDGRMILSVGACTLDHALKHGLEHVNPATVLREHTGLIRRYWIDKKVLFEGKTIRVNSDGLTFNPVRRNIPIWIAANSKLGLRVAGAIGDGVLLDSITSPEYARNALEQVRRGANEAGRDFSALEVAQLIVAAVSKDKKLALDAVRNEVALKSVPLSSSKIGLYTRMSVGEPVLNESIVAKLRQTFANEGMYGLERTLPESMLTSLTACGTRSEVRDRIDEYRRAGVTLPIVRPSNSKVTREVIAAVT